MRNLIKLCVLCLLICCASGAALGQLYQWTDMTTEEAIQAIKDFEGNQSLEVTVVSGPEGDHPDDIWLGLYKYKLTTGGYEYELTDGQMSRNDVVWGNDEQFYDGETDPEVLKTRMLSESETEGIAIAFMNAHYPEPSALNPVPTMSSPGSDNGFCTDRSYFFAQQHPGDVRGPGGCQVGIDTVFGRVISFHSTHFPVLISIQPTLTPEQAAASAVGIMSMTDATLEGAGSLFIYWPDPWGQERLLYSLNISGIPPYDASDWADLWVLPTGVKPEDMPEITIGDTEGCTYIVQVDAHDGNVLDWGVLSGLSEGTGKPIKPTIAKHYPSLSMKLDGKPMRLTSPPVLIGKHPFIGARYLCHGDAKARLAGKDNNTFLLTREGKEFVFTLDSPEYTADGNKNKLPGRPQVVNGRLFVPVEAMKGVLGWNVTYDSKSKTVLVSTGKPK
jgi:hypothetical protein